MDSCRTCLRETIPELGYYLFDSSVRPVTDILMACTSLKILKDDGLPTSICDDCFEKLANFQAFCQLAVESDLLYRKNRHVKVELAEEEPTPAGAFSAGHILITPKEDDNPIKSETNWQPAVSNTPLDDEDDDDEEDDDYDDGNVDDDDEDDVNNAENDSKLVQNSSSSTNDSDPNWSQETDQQPPQPVTQPVDRIEAGQRKRAYAPRPGSRTVDKSVKYTCDMCGKFYYEKARLTGHLRQHCGLRPFPCDQCPKEFDKFNVLRVHRRMHEPPEPTPCPHEGCGKTYRLPRYAQDHYERIHLRRTKAPVECMCDTCGKSFKRRSGLLQHMKSHMAVDQYPYRCEICDKRFLAKNPYTLHMLRHNNIRNFPCPECPLRLVSQLELTYHMANHNRDMSWKCEECPSAFNRKAYLQRHVLKVHRGYKPYVCTDCGRAFGKKWTLKNHALLHTGEKPHACPVCDQRFVQMATLKTHMKVHTSA